MRPVGGPRRQADVLLIAATNVDLEHAVAAGRFRANLLYRINTVDVTLPPLCQRSDFTAITRRLLADIVPQAGLSHEATVILSQHPWPGNARELRNVLTRLTLADPSRTIDADAVATLVESMASVATSAAPGSLHALLAERVQKLHYELNGNVAETARRLSVSRNTVYSALAASLSQTVGAKPDPM